MKFLKKMLIAIYVYLGVFGVAMGILFFLTGVIPDTLIQCVFAGAGIESIVGAIMKVKELSVEKKTEDERKGPGE